MQESLRSALLKENLSISTIEDVLDSGYFLRTWVDPFSGKTWTSVSDMMYGNKQFSCSFAFEEFVAHLKNDHDFEPLPPFRRFVAKNYHDISLILSDQNRTRYIEQGTFSFRGQPSEYTFKRKVPNPKRSNAEGREISIFPGLYRHKTELYSFRHVVNEDRSFGQVLHLLEPNNPSVYLDQSYSYDIMRVEQHYASQTSGLDLTFDIETAIFFATHQCVLRDGLAKYEKIPMGKHCGVIYCFRFCDPPVKKAQYLIEDFDLFRTYPPERILRQNCGLPLIGSDERNIVITDIDCIIELHKDFSYDGTPTPESMFPGISQDLFYKKLLEIKDSQPGVLSNVVEYEWARTT